MIRSSKDWWDGADVLQAIEKSFKYRDAQSLRFKAAHCIERMQTDEERLQSVVMRYVIEAPYSSPDLTLERLVGELLHVIAAYEKSFYAPGDRSRRPRNS